MLQVWSRRIFVLVLGLVAASVIPRVLHAQSGKISGVVTDAATGQPLEGVQVFLQGTGYGNVTNASGRYFILSVPPGIYTAVARRIGYQTVQQPGVQVTADVTRDLAIKMAAAGVNIGAVTVEAVATPLIEPGQTGSQNSITAQQIGALPVNSIEDALSLQQGFIQAPSTTDLISFVESRRQSTDPTSIRGGRAGETLQLIDGIPVNNFIYGGPAFSLSPEAVQQVDLLKGGFGPEFGNALSGVINITTKEGGNNLAGEIKYSTSRLGGSLGNTPDDLLNYSLIEGFASGPVPGTSDRLTFMFSGRQERQADAVHQFDNDIFVPSQRTNAEPYPPFGPSYFDNVPGWRGFGFQVQRQLFGKLAWNALPSGRFTLTLLDNEDQRKPYDFQYFPTYGNPLSSPAAGSSADSAAIIGNATGERLAPLAFPQVVENSIDAFQRLYAGKWDQTIGRTNYKVIGGVFQTRRTTCNYFQGVCLQDNFADPNFTTDRFIGPVVGCIPLPTCGTDQFFGGERLNTAVLRSDITSQVTDHHNLSGGVLYQHYDLNVDVTQDVGTNSVNIYRQQYSNKPYDVAAYFQDKIEYDFLTLKLGARFDYGVVPGTFFANPLDPTNGTTARDVCNDPSNPLWANGVQFGSLNNNGQRVDTLLIPNPAWTNPAACTADTLKLAGQIASVDDFRKAQARKQFSPRLGVSFPLTERSAVFFNFGVYSQNPLLNNLLTNTGIGTPREGLTTGPVLEVPGEGGPGYIGNPNLQIERSTQYEVGYNSEFATNYALNLTLFNKNQTGLTGIRTGGQRLGQFGFEQVLDPGTTYGATNAPSYQIVVNEDYKTVRGVELQLRRRIQNYWGFDINYSYSRTRTNASDPEREFERQVSEGDPNSLFEVPGDLDRPHVFNASLIGQVGEHVPDGRFGWLLRNLTLSATAQLASGFPYTPSTDFFGVSGTAKMGRNSGTGPMSSSVDLLARKGILISNVRYNAFVQVTNLFDAKNCIQVFNTTGNCLEGTIDQNAARQGNALPPDAVTSTFLDRPDFVGQRRRILGGLSVSF